jgi:NADPH:quinone reductase-like Zn-dependent oxidoreductase
MTSEKQNRGLVKRGVNDAVVVNLPYPTLRDEYILVRTIAVALNPADWQDLGEDFKSGSKPLLMGCDYAGIVEAVGKDVKKDLKKGDRVIGFAHGSKELPAVELSSGYDANLIGSQRSQSRRWRFCRIHCGKRRCCYPRSVLLEF